MRRLGAGTNRRGGFRGVGADAGVFFNILGAGATFTRASEGSYYTKPPTDEEGDVNAFLAWAVANTPRIDARDGTPMLLIEGARTNYHTTSRDLGSYTSSGATVITTNTSGAPDGDASSIRVEAPLDEYYYKSTGGLTTGQPYIISQWLRGVSGQTLPMVTRYSPGPDGASIVGEPPTTTWRRKIVSRTPTGTSLNGYANDGRNTSVIGGLAAGARDGMMAMPQVEGGSAASGSFASSFIRTAGGIVTRATDLLTWAAGTWPRSLTENGVEIVVCPTFTSAEHIASGSQITLFSVGGGSTQRAFFTVSGGVSKFRVSSTTLPNQFDQTVSWAARDQRLTITVRPLAGTVTLAGFTTGNGTYSATPWSADWSAAHAASALGIGSTTAGSNQAFSRFSTLWRLL